MVGNTLKFQEVENDIFLVKIVDGPNTGNYIQCMTVGCDSYKFRIPDGYQEDEVNILLSCAGCGDVKDLGKGHFNKRVINPQL